MSLTLTVTEAARELRVSKDKVVGWINEGSLCAYCTPDCKERNHWRIRREDLDAFVLTWRSNLDSEN